MAIRRLKPIVDANGDPFYAVERDYIGAEHANAQAEWTRETHAVLTREHRPDGVHDHLPIPRAVIAGSSWFQGGSGHIAIDPRSTVMGYIQGDGTPHPRNWPGPGSLITGTYLGRGNLRFDFAVPLPSAGYALISYMTGREGTTPQQQPRRFYCSMGSHDVSYCEMFFGEDGFTLLDLPFCFALVC